jgi:Na+-transporting NADH:ubiquinone oxidoreductase subunit B
MEVATMSIKDIKFMKQKNMRQVIISLIPIVFASVYYFGLRSLLLLTIISLTAVITEYIFKFKSKKPVSEAIFVSALLYGLTLPPSTPFWVASLGIIFGIVFGKEVFGGFGRNVFNPALVARAFVYVSFPSFLTTKWSLPFKAFPAGLTKYIAPTIDSVSTATPMLNYRSTGFLESTKNLMFGNISGSLGETCALLIIISGIYLLIKKTASYRSMAGTLLGFFFTSYLMIFMGFTEIPSPFWGIFSGGMLFATVFMVTDPISSAKTNKGKWIYGFIIGSVTVIIRGFALFAGGVMFAVLIGNTFAPIIDEGIKSLENIKKERRDVNA